MSITYNVKFTLRKSGKVRFLEVTHSQLCEMIDFWEPKTTDEKHAFWNRREPIHCTDYEVKLLDLERISDLYNPIERY